MTPVYDKARLRAFVAEWNDPKHPEEAVSEFCRLSADESGIRVGSTVIVMRGAKDGFEFVVSAIDRAEAEVRGTDSGGWWPIETIELVQRQSSRARKRTLVTVGA